MRNFLWLRWRVYAVSGFTVLPGLVWACAVLFFRMMFCECLWVMCCADEDGLGGVCVIR